MPTFKSIPTDIGDAKFATAIATETPVLLTEMAVGDGGGFPQTPSKSQELLANERYRAAITRVIENPGVPGQFGLEFSVPVAEGGYTIREVGVFDSEGDLVIVGNFPDTYKPTADQGATRDLIVRIYTAVSSEAVQVVIDPAVVIASRAWVEQSATRRVDSVFDFQSVTDAANSHQFSVNGLFPGTNVGGGLYQYDSSRNKADHDGLVVVSPTVPWDGTAAALADFIAGTGETDGAGTGCFVRVAGYPSVNAFKAIPAASVLSPSTLAGNGTHFLAPNSAGQLKSFGALLPKIVNDAAGSEAGEIYVVINDGDWLAAVWKWDRDGAAISDVGAPGGIMSVGPGGERVSVVERDYVDARPFGIRNLRDIDPGDLTDLAFRVGLTATMWNASKEEKQIGAIRWRYLNRGSGTEKTAQFSSLLSSGAEVDVQALYAEGAWVVADPSISGANEIGATLFPDDIVGVGGGRGALVGPSGNTLFALIGDGAVADGGGPFGVVFGGRITTGSGKTGRTAFASVTGVKANAVEGDGSGRLEFKTTFGGGGLTRRGYAERGFVWGTPTGGDRGDGTINAQAVYDDNVQLTDYVFDLYLTGTTPDNSPLANSYRETRARYSSVDAFTAFWRKHQHMPSMPSREDWKEKGSISVGDLLQRLWETVELQALHISQLRDEIAAVKEGQ